MGQKRAKGLNLKMEVVLSYSNVQVFAKRFVFLYERFQVFT
jgi:hypothetical protein